MRLERTRVRSRPTGDDIREDAKLNFTNRNDTVQLDGSDLNEDEEHDLKQLQI